MSRRIALVIGISEYKFMPKLTYAQRDAEMVGRFLQETAGFHAEQGGDVCLCTDTSPDYRGYSTHPQRVELRRILRRCFDKTFLNSEDSFWFFFSGHGVRYGDRDYLMPTDGDPEEPDETAIELNYITERLTRSGAGNVVIILDACRSEGQKNGRIDFGRDTPKGVTIIFSCHPKEPAYEIGEPICHSAFTYVLLQSFTQQTDDTAFTVLQMEQYLQIEVPKLNKQHNKPSQMPHIRCDFTINGTKILLPHLKTAKVLQNFQTGSFNLNDSYTLLSDKKSILLKVDSELCSEAGMDYTQLQSFLMNKQWKDADEETHKCINEIAKQYNNKVNNFALSDKEMINFPCQDLFTIDRLWTKYSNNYFGFSIQQAIWQACGSPAWYIDKGWNKFGIVVGWRKKGWLASWLNYSDFSYNQSAPRGHLPARTYSCVMGGADSNQYHRSIFYAALFSRMNICRK